MAHELLFDGDQASIFTVGEKPWHNLGANFTQPPKTAEEAIKAARIDWKVDLIPLYAAAGGFHARVPDRFAVVRQDLWGKEGSKLFGIVGAEYRPLQNSEAFHFFDAIIETGLVTYESAGALKDGERVWVLARVKGDISVVDQKIERYLLLSNGHDGKTAVNIRFTPIRVVCQNTLSWAEEERSPLFHIYHDQRMERRVKKAEEAIKGILAEYDKVEVLFNRFAKTPMEVVPTAGYFTNVFPDPRRHSNERASTYEGRLEKVRETRRNAARLAKYGRGNKAVQGTLWAAYNGVTELVDHEWGYDDFASRLNSLWFGDGERVKIRALTEAAKLCRN